MYTIPTEIQTPYLSYTPPPPLVYLLYACSEFNIIIAYKKASIIAEENRGSQM